MTKQIGYSLKYCRKYYIIINFTNPSAYSMEIKKTH